MVEEWRSVHTFVCSVYIKVLALVLERGGVTDAVLAVDRSPTDALLLHVEGNVVVLHEHISNDEVTLCTCVKDTQAVVGVGSGGRVGDNVVGTFHLQGNRVQDELNLRERFTLRLRVLIAGSRDQASITDTRRSGFSITRTGKVPVEDTQPWLVDGSGKKDRVGSRVQDAAAQGAIASVHARAKADRSAVDLNVGHCEGEKDELAKVGLKGGVDKVTCIQAGVQAAESEDTASVWLHAHRVDVCHLSCLYQSLERWVASPRGPSREGHTDDAINHKELLEVGCLGLNQAKDNRGGEASLRIDIAVEISLDSA